MLEVCNNAPMLAKACVAVHNKLNYDTRFRRRLALIPLGLALIIWVGSYMWYTNVNNAFKQQQYLAGALLAAFDASDKAVLVTDEDGKVLGSSKASDRLLGIHKPGSSIIDDFPQLELPIQTAIGASQVKSSKHSVTQLITRSFGPKSVDMQVQVISAMVLDEHVVVITVLPACEVDATFIDGDNPGTVSRMGP